MGNASARSLVRQPLTRIYPLPRRVAARSSDDHRMRKEEYKFCTSCAAAPGAPWLRNALAAGCTLSKVTLADLWLLLPAVTYHTSAMMLQRRLLLSHGPSCSARV